MYKWRHLIENFFCKLKEFKRIAMRADKIDESFSAIVYLAAPIIHSRYSLTSLSHREYHFPFLADRVYAGNRISERCMAADLLSHGRLCRLWKTACHFASIVVDTLYYPTFGKHASFVKIFGRRHFCRSRRPG